MVTRRATCTILFLACTLVACVALRMILGTDGVAWPADAEIRGLRLHRVGLASVCGAALAVAGVVLQAFLRNPLASPDLTGVAAGSGLGVLVAAFLAYGLGEALSPAMFGPAALVGALATLFLVGAASRRSGRSDPVAMVLIGVSVGIMAAALGLLVQQAMPPDPSRPVTRWLIGSLDEQMPGWVVVAGACVVVLCTGAIALAGPTLDAASLSDEEAASVGVRVGVLRWSMFLIAGTLTSVAVVLGGPIGFVGLVCPHVVRTVAGPAHRSLVIGAALAGGVMLVGADVVVRVCQFDHGRLPIGVVTALIGAPVLIMMIRKGVGAWGAAP